MPLKVKAEIQTTEILALGKAYKSSEAEGKSRNLYDRDPCIR